ncbi:hypothetical protein DFP72DRAFT_1018729 [Ephemerocybe angulata]|uniref:Uncharacterized protein n=1 Tax=Ephemerocybe angulata TaxID=980116 RepID=A0A8H6LXB6_9AGAR|nr:hypothetical protein DFP72DRAFT_1018729 [Tulosesus angulatus]
MSTPVVAGFSLTNRLLIYFNFLLAPAHLLAGGEITLPEKLRYLRYFPSNLGFLAYDCYQQVLWYKAINTEEIHALSLVIAYLNAMYAITYLAGLSAANHLYFSLQALGVAGMLTINAISGWINCTQNLPKGDGVYRFWFFGWRRLSEGWRGLAIFIQVLITLGSLILAIVVIILARRHSQFMGKYAKEQGEPWGKWWRIGAIALLTLIVLIFGWPLALWMELVVLKNGLVSETDWVAVYLFIAQVVMMIIPGFVVTVAAHLTD